MIILHGGPGASETPFFRLYNSRLEDDFVVAYWDQRGAGRSYRDDIPPDSMRIDQFVADLDALVNHLTARFDKRKVVLLGHSWGSALGILYASEHPEKVLAYIGTGQISKVPRAEALGYEYALGQARARGDADAAAELEGIGPPPHDVGQMLVSRKWVERFGGSFVRGVNYFSLTLDALGTSEATIKDLFRFWRGNQFSLRILWPELRELDLTRRAPCLAVPVTFLLGRHDWQVPSTAAQEYWTMLRAPWKRVVWFENSAHNVPFEEPQKFNHAVIEAVREGRSAPRPADASDYCGKSDGGQTE